MTPTDKQTGTERVTGTELLGGEVAGATAAATRDLRAQGRKTLRKLLRSGAAVFEEQGYHAARVDDIVARAKTSHGTFYLYFTNKEDLLRELASQCYEELDALAHSLARSRPTTLDGRSCVAGSVSTPLPTTAMARFCGHGWKTRRPTGTCSGWGPVSSIRSSRGSKAGWLRRTLLILGIRTLAHRRCWP
ncbi:MAG: helix-turn-helix transcriptional regulator [Acidimicrobiia bacterium]|nr:helix-turn-helix transcriptional regulator [Acidimicrobiia bacterium]